MGTRAADTLLVGAALAGGQTLAVAPQLVIRKPAQPRHFLESVGRRWPDRRCW